MFQQLHMPDICNDATNLLYLLITDLIITHSAYHTVSELNQQQVRPLVTGEWVHLSVFDKEFSKTFIQVSSVSIIHFFHSLRTGSVIGLQNTYTAAFTHSSYNLIILQERGGKRGSFGGSGERIQKVNWPGESESGELADAPVHKFCTIKKWFCQFYVEELHWPVESRSSSDPFNTFRMKNSTNREPGLIRSLSIQIFCSGVHILLVMIRQVGKKPTYLNHYLKLKV